MQPDGIETIKQQLATLSDLLKEIMRVVGLSEDRNGFAEEELKAAVFSVLEMGRFLLIIDNLETVDEPGAIWNFLIDHRFAFPTKVIVTSRHRQESAELVVNVRGMTHDQVESLVADEAERLNYNIEGMIDENAISLLLEKTGGLPIAIKQVVAHASKGISLAEAIARLPKQAAHVLDFCFPESFKLLTQEARELFFALHKIGEPVGSGELLFVTNFSQENLEKCLMELRSMSLVERTIAGNSGELYHLLPLTNAFAAKEMTKYANIEERLLPRLVELQDLSDAAPFETPVSVIAGIVTSERMLQMALTSAARASFSKADYWFDKAIKTGKADSQIWLAKAKYEYKDKQEIEQARQSFAQAAKLLPNWGEVYTNWGHMERAEKNWGKASDLFRKALQLDSDNKYAHHGLGLTLYDRGVTEKEHGKRQNDRNRINSGQQDIKASVNHLGLALFSSPTEEREKHHNVVTYYVLSKALNRLNSNSKAIAICEEALMLEPYNGRIKSWQRQLQHWDESSPGHLA